MLLEQEGVLAQARKFLVRSATQYVEYVESSLKEGSTHMLQLMKLIQNDLQGTLENLDFDHKLSVSEGNLCVIRYTLRVREGKCVYSMLALS